MAVQDNQIAQVDFAKVISIDFVERFTESIQSLMNLLGIMRKTPMSNGSLIKVYSNAVALESGTVEEGELIPLSKVEQTLAATYELEYQKFRKAVSLEAIQRVGYNVAVQDTDTYLLREVQHTIRQQFVDFLAQGQSTASGSDLQEAVANAWGILQVLFEDDSAGSVVVIANPMDVATYIGQAAISTQTAFGLTYFTAFTNVQFLVSASVPQGTFYATVADNINIAYPLISSGEIAKAFDFTTDSSGLVGITHTTDNTRANYETTIITGLTLFAERIDGVVIGTIG